MRERLKRGRQKNKETLDKFKIEDKNASILVANFEDALSEDEVLKNKIKRNGKKMWIRGERTGKREYKRTGYLKKRYLS